MTSSTKNQKSDYPIDQDPPQSFAERMNFYSNVNPPPIYAYSILIHCSSDRLICPFFDALFDFDSFNRLQSDSHLFKAA